MYEIEYIDLTNAFSISSFTTERRSTITCPLAIFAISPPLIFFNVPEDVVDMEKRRFPILNNGGKLKNRTSTELQYLGYCIIDMV